MSYALRLSPEERARYRFMAEAASGAEAGEWATAGIGAGARVADIGCGPGAMLRVLAETAGPDGRADGVDHDTEAVAAAGEEIAGLAQASVRAGSATDSGLEPSYYDAVMCRHVLAHNGGKEAAIVAHLAALTRPGGAVLLVDADGPAIRMHPDDPDLADLIDRYREFHRAQGNDLTVGVKLGWLLEHAGLTVESFRSGGPVLRVPPMLRPPSWAAREAMVQAGFADADDLARWEAAFQRVDQLSERPDERADLCGGRARARRLMGAAGPGGRGGRHARRVVQSGQPDPQLVEPVRAADVEPARCSAQACGRGVLHPVARQGDRVAGGVARAREARARRH